MIERIAKIASPVLLLAWHLCLLVAGVFALQSGSMPIAFANLSELFLPCLLAGLAGGVIYCIRGIYLHFCVSQNWTNRWIVWHLGRPFVSTVCGGVCYLFLKAGLLLLQDESELTDFSPYVYYVLAFMAGYNVDNFLRKLEYISKAVMGISESRASKESEKDR